VGAIEARFLSRKFPAFAPKNARGLILAFARNGERRHCEDKEGQDSTQRFSKIRR